MLSSKEHFYSCLVIRFKGIFIFVPLGYDFGFVSGGFINAAFSGVLRNQIQSIFFFFPTSIPHLPPAMFLLAFSNLQSIRTFADLVGLTFFFLQCFLLVRLESETSIFHDQFSVVLIMAGQIVSEVLGTKTKR